MNRYRDLVSFADYRPCGWYHFRLSGASNYAENAEVLKDACNYVAFELKDVAVLNYLGANTRASNIDRVNRALEPEGQGPSRARVVIGESQKIAMATGSIYANLDTVRHVGRLTRDQKAGECDHFACAILEGMLNNEDFQQQAPQIEILANGGHAFVVVNRRDETELNEIDNWQDAILVDIWKYQPGRRYGARMVGHGIAKPPYICARESDSEPLPFRCERLALGLM